MIRAVAKTTWRAQAGSVALDLSSGLRDLGTLRRVFVAREGWLLSQLAAKMSAARGPADTFDIWMKEESGLVQACAAPTWPYAGPVPESVCCCELSGISQALAAVPMSM